MTADMDILAEADFAGGGGCEWRGEQAKNEQYRRKRPSGGGKTNEFHEPFPPLLSQPIAGIAQFAMDKNNRDPESLHKHVNVAKYEESKPSPAAAMRHKGHCGSFPRSTNRFFLCKLTIWLDFDKPICYLA